VNLQIAERKNYLLILHRCANSMYAFDFCEPCISFLRLSSIKTALSARTGRTGGYYTCALLVSAIKDSLKLNLPVYLIIIITEKQESIHTWLYQSFFMCLI